MLLSGSANGPSTTTFMDIPWDLKRMIVRECHLGRTSDRRFRYSNIAFSTLPATYRFHVQNLISATFTDHHCEMLDDRNLRITTLSISNGDFRCGAERFNKFLMDHHVGHIDFTSHSTPDDNPPEYDRILRLPAVIKLSSVSVSEWDSDVAMESILGLGAASLRLPSIDSSTINTLLKEWQSGKRRIDSFWFGNVADSDSFNHDAPPRWNQNMKSLFFDGLYGVKEEENARPTSNKRIQATLPRHGSELGLYLALNFYAHNRCTCYMVEYEGIPDLRDKLFL